VQPVTLATIDSQLMMASAGTVAQSQPQQLPMPVGIASLSVETAMASVTLTVNFIYRAADVVTTGTLPPEQCSVAPDGRLPFSNILFSQIIWL